MAHWYAWFPGDYLRDTQHLSMLEDAAYRRMLDSYYMTEHLSANADVLLRICRAVTADEQAAVRKVATEFFDERDGRLYHERVEQGIAKSRAVSGKRSDAGKRGAAKTNATRAANASPSAAANASANVAANAAANASSIPEPEPEVNLPPSEGAVAPSASDPIFGFCLGFLVSKGVAEKNARSILGKWRQAQGNEAVIEAVRKAKAEDVSDPVAWLTKALANKPTKTKATNYATTEYRKEEL